MFTRGTILRCPVCKAEITVISPTAAGSFRPHCCNTAMQPLSAGASFYKCETCQAEVAVIKRCEGKFNPHCCNRPMVAEKR